ncbi:MAG: ATP-binding protein [Desulfatirhabdiaceae bacterium]
MQQHLTLRVRIMLGFVIVALIPSVMIAGYGVYHHITKFQQIMIDNFQATNQIARQKIELSLGRDRENLLTMLYTDVLYQLTQSPADISDQNPISEELKKRLQTLFAIVHRSSGRYDRIRFIDRQGMEIVRVDWDGSVPQPVESPYLRNRSDTDWFQKSVLLPPEEIYVSPVQLAPENGDPVRFNPTICMAMPVLNKIGMSQGILVINIMVGMVFQDALESFVSQDNEWFVSDSTGNYVFYNTWAWGQSSSHHIDKSIRTYFPDLAARIITGKETHIQNSIHHIFITPIRFISDKDVFMLLGQVVPVSAMKKPMQVYLLYFSGVFVFSLLISLVTSYFLSRQITRPIAHLQKSAAQIAGGQFNKRVQLTGSPELMDLSRDFNSMAERLTREMLWEKQYGRAIVNSIADGVYSIDSQHHIRSWNTGAERLTGFLMDDVIGRHCNEILHFQNEQGDVLRQSDQYPMIDSLTGKETPQQSQIYTRCKNGELVPVALAASPLIGPDRQIMGTVLVFRDVSKEKALLESIRAADQAKSNFMSGMSHELRTPLHAIIGFADVLAEQYVGPLNADQLKYVDDIRASGKHLSDLVDDILDVAQLKESSVELNLSRIPVSGLMKNCLIKIHEAAYKKGIHLKLDIAEKCKDLSITVDARKLRQAIDNLLTNAVKFTMEKGQIRLSVDILQLNSPWNSENGSDAAKGNLDNKPALEIMVEDTGIGIEPENHENIFGSFYQIQNGLVDKTPGTGLGLTLTRSIVELHHGEIWVESDGHGKGSRFIIRLPIGESDLGISMVNAHDQVI